MSGCAFTEEIAQGFYEDVSLKFSEEISQPTFIDALCFTPVATDVVVWDGVPVFWDGQPVVHTHR